MRSTARVIPALLPAALAAVFALPPEAPAALPVNNRIDEFVSARLQAAGITPSEVCSDEVFLRRAYLDLLGTIPRAEAARTFLASRDPDKRRRLVDELLAWEECADYQAMKWCDILRVKSEFPGNLWPNAVQAYHRWIRQALAENMPYDQFARALLTSAGSNFRDPPVNFYRVLPGHEPEKIAEFTALVFMGARLQRWPEHERRGLAAFFSRIGYKKTGEWKEEIVYDRRTEAAAGADFPGAGLVPGAAAALELDPDRDPRAVFADWLTAPDNQWFARNAVNRIWFWLTGRGIVHEPDDFGPHNPPLYPELLDWLASEFVAGGFDARRIYRLVMNSATYQLSSTPNAGNASDEAHFSRGRPRRLDAEVLIDAVGRVTSTGEQYLSRVPEPFTFIPARNRTVALADGSIDSSFLAMFGRPPRNTGYLLERTNEMSAIQRMHMLNSTHIHDKIYRPQFLRRLIGQFPTDEPLTAAVYLAVLSRLPAAGERETALGYFRDSGLTREEATADLVWALVNTAEFSFRY